jgi:hypothetical protein
MTGAPVTEALRPRAPRWRRLGQVYVPERAQRDGPASNPANTWRTSHGALPWAHLTEDGVQVYFSPRDADGRAHVGRLLLDLGPDGAQVGSLDPAPVLSPGRLGAFDDRGVTMSCIVEQGGRLYLYYTGWTLGVTVPFYFYVGLALSDDGGQTFARVSEAPILERNAIDPFLTASPSVLVDGGVWRMWYISALGWEAAGETVQHRYHVRYAESVDGITWRRDGRVCVDFATPDEYAFGRPCVIRDRDGYRMWYCVRGEAYRIGYAESADGLAWTRHDALAGITPAADGWDAEMLAYPAVFDARGRRYLLYNGNGYGRTGFGLAVAQEQRSSATGDPGT